MKTASRKRKRTFNPDGRNTGGRFEMTQQMYNHYNALLNAKPTIKVPARGPTEEELYELERRAKSGKISTKYRKDPAFRTSSNYNFPISAPAYPMQGNLKMDSPFDLGFVYGQFRGRNYKKSDQVELEHKLNLRSLARKLEEINLGKTDILKRLSSPYGKEPLFFKPSKTGYSSLNVAHAARIVPAKKKRRIKPRKPKNEFEGMTEEELIEQLMREEMLRDARRKKKRAASKKRPASAYNQRSMPLEIETEDQELYAKPKKKKKKLKRKGVSPQAAQYMTLKPPRSGTKTLKKRGKKRRKTGGATGEAAQGNQEEGQHNYYNQIEMAIPEREEEFEEDEKAHDAHHYASDKQHHNGYQYDDEIPGYDDLEENALAEHDLIKVEEGEDGDDSHENGDEKLKEYANKLGISFDEDDEEDEYGGYDGIDQEELEKLGGMSDQGSSGNKRYDELLAAEKLDFEAIREAKIRERMEREKEEQKYADQKANEREQKRAQEKQEQKRAQEKQEQKRAQEKQEQKRAQEKQEQERQKQEQRENERRQKEADAQRLQKEAEALKLQKEKERESLKMVENLDVHVPKMDNGDFDHDIDNSDEKAIIEPDEDEQEMQDDRHMQDGEGEEELNEELLQYLNEVPVLEEYTEAAIEEFQQALFHHIINYQIFNPEEFDILFQATCDRNENIDPKLLESIFAEVAEILQQQLQEAGDGYEDEDGDGEFVEYEE